MDFCDSLPGQTNTTWQVPGQGETPAQKKTEKKEKEIENQVDDGTTDAPRKMFSSLPRHMYIQTRTAIEP